jgi:hypothetical protein
MGAGATRREPPDGSISRWHPWYDKPGQRHSLKLWSELLHNDMNTVEKCIDEIAGGQLYALCTDVFAEEEIPFRDELLKVANEQEGVYLRKNGGVVALKLQRKRRAGFVIPAHTWGASEPTSSLIKDIIQPCFDIFGYEAITPASLSEKVLRGTLGPFMPSIYRPSIMLRRDLLHTPHGGRIETAKELRYFETLFEYDINKAYPFFAREVPSPWSRPVGFLGDALRGSRDAWMGFPTAFIKCRLIARNTRGIQPIQLFGVDAEPVRDGHTGNAGKGNRNDMGGLQDRQNKDRQRELQLLSVSDEHGIARQPREGEVIERWFWSEELLDCLDKGYTLDRVERGYGFREMSTFMQAWADILCEAYERQIGTPVSALIKTMLVGLPGRFLRLPETYLLVHESEGLKQGDINIDMTTRNPGDNIGTPWYIRRESDPESTALTPIGSYIVMKCRQDLYRRMKHEEDCRNTVVSAYIDCFRTTGPTVDSSQIGLQVGQVKQKVWSEAIIKDNQIDGYNEEGERISNIPGMAKGSTERQDLLRKMYDLRIQKKEKVFV